MRTSRPRNVFATRSGSAWNFVQKPHRRPTLARLGTNKASQRPIRSSTWPRYAFEARQHSSMDKASPRVGMSLSVGRLTTVVRPISAKKVCHSAA